MQTSLTERLGLRHPIVQAPMGGVSGPELADAVSRAGALGMLTAGAPTTAARLQQDVDAARERVGIGLLAWRLDEEPELLDVALAAQPAAISISAGDAGPWVERVRGAGIPLFVQVSSAEAARAANADFVVAQGTDAGGHTGAVGTMPLLEAVLAAVGDEVPVLAAGGIATGRGLAGVLAMGAAGAWMGTRFAATREALGGDERKQRLLDARETDTIRTQVYDRAERLGWPPEYAGRVIRDEFTDRWHGREEELVASGEQAHGHLSAGPAVGAIDDIPPAGELVVRMSRQADELLRRFV
jgi:nitronate monooxygenase